jgi:hypothetical protein
MQYEAALMWRPTHFVYMHAAKRRRDAAARPLHVAAHLPRIYRRCVGQLPNLLRCAEGRQLIAQVVPAEHINDRTCTHIDIRKVHASTTLSDPSCQAADLIRKLHTLTKLPGLMPVVAPGCKLEALVDLNGSVHKTRCWL